MGLRRGSILRGVNRGLSRREFLTVSASAPLALASVLGTNIEAAESSTRLPLLVLFLSGGASSKETFNPDPSSVTSELRGPLASIPTRTPGVHFSEPWPELAARTDKFALLRALDSGSSEHTKSQQTAILSGGKTVTEKIGDRSANGGVPYVLLNPGSTWEGLILAFQQAQSFSPLWDPIERRFKAPQMTPVANLKEKRQLLEAFDQGVPGAATARMQKFRETAFDLLQGGGKFMDALTLPGKDRERYGKTLAGDMVLTAKRFIEEGAGSVTIYHEPQATDPGESPAWDMHSKIGEKMKGLAPEVDHAAAMLVDEITSHRLECVLLLMGEFNRSPRMDDGNGTGRGHCPTGNCAILAGGKIRPGVVHGKTDKFNRAIDGEVKQKSVLPNTVLVACGEEVSPAEPRIRDILT